MVADRVRGRNGTEQYARCVAKGSGASGTVIRCEGSVGMRKIGLKRTRGQAAGNLRFRDARALHLDLGSVAAHRHRPTQTFAVSPLPAPDRPGRRSHRISRSNSAV